MTDHHDGGNVAELRLIPAPAEPLDPVEAEDWLRGFLAGCQAVVQLGLKVEDSNAREAVGMLAVDLRIAIKACLDSLVHSRNDAVFYQTAWSEDIASELALIVATQGREYPGTVEEVYDALAQRLADHPSGASSAAEPDERSPEDWAAVMNRSDAYLEIIESNNSHWSNILPVPEPTRLRDLSRVLAVAEETLFLLQNTSRADKDLIRNLEYDAWVRVSAVHEALATGKWRAFEQKNPRSEDLTEALAHAEHADGCRLASRLVEEAAFSADAECGSKDTEYEPLASTGLRGLFDKKTIERLVALHPDRLQDALDDIRGMRMGPAELES